ncbi:MAG: hypothetical protein JWO38_6323 [Gemmataceae bacterium]|nr:hypothetical protein [Gemmataceae bacterium]
MKWLKRSLFTLAVLASTAPLAPAADKKVKPAADIEVVRDVSYTSGAEDKQKLDLYLPRGKKDYPIDPPRSSPPPDRSNRLAPRS